MRKLIPALMALAFLSACNNSAPTSSESEGSEESKAEEANSDVLPAVPEGASVFFVNLKDGDTVTSPVFVEFGIDGMTVEPAGEVHAGMGHHHIIIDGNAIESEGVVPADEVNIHYGGGQTSDSLILAPGIHKLTMQFADGYHRSYGPQMSESIKVFVVE